MDAEKTPTGGELIVYQTDDGRVKLDVRLQDETIWLTQADLADLFGVKPQNITIHLKNIYAEGELQEDATCKEFLQVQTEGVRKVERIRKFYNLDAVISVGYRIQSRVATHFRIWATQRLKEYIVKGFTMDDERLKNPPVKGSPVPDYFDEMLARIRDIRASESRMYLRVREIFAMAEDYEPKAADTARFFSVIQNKLHFAATGLTAAELIKARADHGRPNMGLTAWKGSEVLKTDVTIAKNYLHEDEIEELNRIVTMWLDFAEDQAKRRKQVFMRDWQQRLDDFLRFNDRRVLPNAGGVSKKTAEDHATKEYEIFADDRRKQKESLAEADYLKQLEEAARQLPASRKKSTQNG
jgi:hypothetical protein